IDSTARKTGEVSGEQKHTQAEVLPLEGAGSVLYRSNPEDGSRDVVAETARGEQVVLSDIRAVLREDINTGQDKTHVEEVRREGMGGKGILREVDSQTGDVLRTITSTSEGIVPVSSGYYESGARIVEGIIDGREVDTKSSLEGHTHIEQFPIEGGGYILKEVSNDTGEVLREKPILSGSKVPASEAPATPELEPESESAEAISLSDEVQWLAGRPFGFLKNGELDFENGKPVVLSEPGARVVQGAKTERLTDTEAHVELITPPSGSGSTRLQLVDSQTGKPLPHPTVEGAVWRVDVLDSGKVVTHSGKNTEVVVGTEFDTGDPATHLEQELRPDEEEAVTNTFYVVNSETGAIIGDGRTSQTEDYNPGPAKNHVPVWRR
ncbi:MAG: hypothetical protein WD049_04045, partial [Candidatus Paceibacterota bacterium]